MSSSSSTSVLKTLRSSPALAELQSPKTRTRSVITAPQEPLARKLQSSSGQIKTDPEEMGSRLGRRVVHFANLPIKLLMPTSFTNIIEIALKTVLPASKIEIKRVLKSLYGFEVDKVRTLNMEGKKKKWGGLLVAKPDYKKAYVTLRTPLSILRDLFPIQVVEKDRRSANKQGGSSMVEEGERKRHWLKMEDGERRKQEKEFGERVRGGSGAKFPWSFMKSGR